MVEKIEELCRELEKILHDNFTYVGVDFDDGKNRLFHWFPPSWGIFM